MKLLTANLVLHSKQSADINDKTKTIQRLQEISYGPTVHQHQELPAHYESLFGGLHRVHHSILQYCAEYGCPGKVSLSSV